MAEAEANPSLGGYDDDFVSEVKDELQCAICRLPLKDPIFTKCGHRFCRDCLDSHFTRLVSPLGFSEHILRVSLVQEMVTGQYNPQSCSVRVITLFKYAMLFCVSDHLSSE